MILRNVLENPAWYTAYTPYQPEISQGRLEALLNFQTMVSDLTGMDLANASLLDEATAAAEAMAHAAPGQRRRRGDTFFVDADCHPQTIDVVRTRAEPLGIDVVVGRRRARHAGRGRVRRAAAVPGHHRRGPRRPRARRATCTRRARSSRSPPTSSRWCCSPRRGSGAPTWWSARRSASVCRWATAARTPAFFATRDEYKRNLPGRLVGVSVDAAGRPALRLALQTREQHIRREKATSNICTAQVLLAIIAGLYAVYHGPDGLRAIAERVHELAVALAAALRAGGVDVATTRSSTRSRCASPGAPTRCSRARASAGVNLRRVDADTVGIALDETTTAEIVERGRAAFGVEPDADATARRAGRRSRRRCGARPTSSRTRCSARTTPRPRCCATCAGSPTATSRSTAR